MSIPVLMPALSPTMTEGKLAKWHVKVGDAVKSGQVICEIETDKATMEVEAVDEGTVAQDPGRGRHRRRRGQHADLHPRRRRRERRRRRQVGASRAAGRAAPKAEAGADRGQAAPPQPKAAPPRRRPRPRLPPSRNGPARPST